MTFLKTSEGQKLAWLLSLDGGNHRLADNPYDLTFVQYEFSYRSTIELYNEKNKVDD